MIIINYYKFKLLGTVKLSGVLQFIKHKIPYNIIITIRKKITIGNKVTETMIFHKNRFCSKFEYKL